MRHIALFFTFAFLLLAASCSRPGSVASSADPGEEEKQSVRETGDKAVTALMTRLGGQLKGALQSSGPVEAIQVCQQVAMPLTAAAGTEFENVQIRRTTLKPRNPANAPDETDHAILIKMAAIAKTSSAPPEPEIVWQPSTARYYKPLLIQEVCLKCHGNPETFSPELKETLATLYPEDQATGYSLGELRGLIRVDISRQ